MEHLLLLTTVERIGDSLPFSPPSQRRRGAPREYLKEYINTLNDVIVLPQIQLHKVIQPLLDLYNNISKISLTKGCKNRSSVLKRLELVYESKLIILSLFSDYLNFAVPDKSKCQPNHHFENLFYNFDSDDLLIEELKPLEDNGEDSAMLEQLEQSITEVIQQALNSQHYLSMSSNNSGASSSSNSSSDQQDNAPSTPITKQNSSMMVRSVLSRGRPSDSESILSSSPPTTPIKSALAQQQQQQQMFNLSASPALRAGSFVKRRGESVHGSDVKALDETVAHNLAGLVVTRLLRGFDIGEENPEHILNCVERFQDFDSKTESDLGSPSSSNNNTSDSTDYDPYAFGGVSRNNIEVFKDSHLRIIERKMRFKCTEILFKLSCTSFSTVYTRIEEVIANQNGANSSTAAQMMDLKIKEEQEKEAEEQSGSGDGDVSLVVVSKDERVPFDESFDSADGMKVLQIVQYLNLTGSALSQIFQSLVTQTSKQFIKYIEQFDLADSLRLAIWNWILMYRTEFLTLHTQGKSHPGASELFDVLFTYQKGKKDRRVVVSPLMTMLLLLCPDKLAKSLKSSKGSDNMSQFIHKTLLKVIVTTNKKVKEKPLAISVLESFVEILRVSAMFNSSGEKNAVQLLLEQGEEALRDIFINNTGSISKYFGLTNMNYELNPYITIEKEVELTAYVAQSYFMKDMNGSVKTILPKLVQSGALETEAMYKRLSLCKAILSLIVGPCPRQGSNRVPGNSNMFASMYTAVASDLRDTLQEITTSYMNMSKKNEIIGQQQDYFMSLNMYDSSEIPSYYSSSVAKKKRTQSSQKGVFLLNRGGSTQLRNRYQCMMDTMNTVLQLFSADPNMFLVKGAKDSAQHIEKSFLVLANSFVSVRHPEVQEQCVRLLSKLFLEKYVLQWLSPNSQSSSALIKGLQVSEVHQIMSYVTVVSSVLSRLSRALFEEQVTATIQKIISLIRHITFTCKIFYMRNREHLTGEVVNDAKRLNTLETLASNVLVSLCNPDKDIWKTTCKTLRDICDQIELLHNQNIKSLNYAFNRQLSSVNLEADLQDIQMERRNQIQLFRRIEVQTQSSVTAFDEVFRLWRELIKVPEHQNDEWRDKLTNYTSLLCALGGVCLQSKTKSNSLDAFMSELMDHVTSSDPLIRQVVAYSVAIDTAPALYDKLFHYMYKTMKNLTEQNQSEAKAMRVTEQYVFICKTIVESKEATGDLTLASDLDKLVTLLVQFISSKSKRNGATNTPNLSRMQSVSNMDPPSPVSTTNNSSIEVDVEKELVQMKLRLSLLIETFMNKSEYISFENEQAFRKRTIQQLLPWTSFFAFKGSQTQQKLFKIDPQHVDLDMNCMRAISSLLSGYILDNDSEQEYSEYFTFLIQYLEKTPKSHTTFMTFIKKGLNALLSVNSGFSLEYFMTMVYNHDEHVRSTFLSLLGTLMKRRKFNANDDVDDDDETDDDKKQSDEVASTENKYARIVQDLFLRYNHRPVFILFDQIKSNEKDDACDAFVVIYQSMGYAPLLDMLNLSIQLEVNSTSVNQPGTLFRANSTASKLMKKYCARVAGPYLKSVLGPLMDKVCNNPKNFEIDPSKVKDGEDVNVNVANTKQVIQEFIDTILNNIDQIPYQFREYCRYLYKSVGNKFQMIDDPTREEDVRGRPLEEYELDYSHISVGGFLFLRLICPAVTSPQLYGLTKDLPGNDARRFSIIITKVLQNISNGIFQSRKEPFMQTFEEFTKNNLIKFKKFFAELATDPVDEEESLRRQQNAMPENVTEEEMEDSYGTVHRYLSDYQEASRSALQAFFTSSDPSAEIRVGTEQSSEPSAYDVLSTWLNKAGRPPEKKKTTNTKNNAKEYSSIIFEQFIQKTEKIVTENKEAQKVLESIENKQIFFVGGISKKQGHIVYFVPQRLSAAELYVHIDILLYHILITLRKIFQQQYVLVVDCTLWEPHMEIPFATIIKLSKFMPMGAKKNLSEVVFINPNNSFKKFLKKFSSMMKKSNQLNVVTAIGEKDPVKWAEILNVDVEKTTQYLNENKKADSTITSIVPLPAVTLNIQKETTFVSSVQRVSSTSIIDSQLVLTKDCLYVVTKEKTQLVGKPFLYNRVDHFHVEGISEIAAKRSARAMIGRSKDLQFKYDPNVKTANDSSNYTNSNNALVTAPVATISLRHTEREKLMQVISDAAEVKRKENEKNAAQFIPPTTEKKQKQRLKPSDVPGQLLNICFLNLESSNSATRYAAYNLLTSIIEQFQLPIYDVLESDIISVPRNTEDLVLEMSELVSNQKPDITLEFLNEALSAFSQIEPKSQVMCAKYLKPWIHNLSFFYYKGGESEDKKKENEKAQPSEAVVASGKIEANETTHKKLAEWFLRLARVSCESSQVFPAVAELWTLISQENQKMLYMGLEAAIQYGVEMGAVEADQSLINDLVVTLSVHCPKEENVALTIINSIIDCLLPKSNTTENTNTLNICDLMEKEPNEIYNDKNWSKIIIYLRFLMNLSFQNRLNVVENLPHLLNLLVLLVGVGQDICIRSTLHGLCCNIIHSLLTELPFLTSKDINRDKKVDVEQLILDPEMQALDKKILEYKQNVINNTKKLNDKNSIRGVFMGSPNIEPAPFAKLTTENKKLSFDTCNMLKVESLVRFLIDTMSNWTDHWNGLWMVEWQKMCKSILENESILNSKDTKYHLFYARSLVTYSLLTCEKPGSNGEKEIISANDDSTAYAEEEEHKDHLSKLGHNIITLTLKFLSQQSLSELMPSTNNSSADSKFKYKQQQDLLLSIVLTLGRFVQKLKPSTDAQQLQLTESLFLTGLVLLAIVDARIYNAVLRTMGFIVSSLHDCGVLDKYENLSEYMNDRLRGTANPLCSGVLEEFEQVTGISFKEHFSFAMSILLMKALVGESTRDDAAALLKQFHMLQNKLHWHPRESLGYFCGLIAFDRQYSTNSFCDFMYQREVFEHPNGVRVFLFQKYLFTLVTEINTASANNEQAMLCIYKTLNKGFDSKIRSLFTDVFKDHHSMSHVVRTYTSSENDKIIEACMNLFKSMSNEIRGTALSMKEPFQECGFGGFKKHRTFKVVNSGEELKSVVIPTQNLLCKLLRTLSEHAVIQQIAEQSESASQSIALHKQKVLEQTVARQTKPSTSSASNEEAHEDEHE